MIVRSLYILMGMLLWVVHFTSGQELNKRKVVVMDPGHGGTDSGAVGINGIQEKDVVLKIAMEVIRLNMEIYRDTLQIFSSTRYSDTLISLRTPN